MHQFHSVGHEVLLATVQVGAVAALVDARPLFAGSIDGPAQCLHEYCPFTQSHSFNPYTPGAQYLIHAGRSAKQAVPAAVELDDLKYDGHAAPVMNGGTPGTA